MLAQMTNLHKPRTLAPSYSGLHSGTACLLLAAAASRPPPGHTAGFLFRSLRSIRSDAFASCFYSGVLFVVLLAGSSLHVALGLCDLDF